LGKNPHSVLASHVPSAVKHGVMSMPLCSSIHGTAWCMSTNPVPLMHAPLFHELMPNTRQVSSPPSSDPSLTNTGPPESPLQVDLPLVPPIHAVPVSTLIALIVVVTWRFGPADPPSFSSERPKPTAVTSRPGDSTPSSHPMRIGTMGTLRTSWARMQYWKSLGVPKSPVQFGDRWHSWTATWRP
jgi:hypothetical protein